MDKFTRACPNCDKEIKHKSLRSLRESERKKCLCRSCGAKSRVEKYGINKSFAKFAQKGHGLGNKNPFYGKTHSEETKDKIRNRDKSFFNSKEYKEKQRINSSGKNNPMYGISVYQLWVSKHGTEKADELMEKFKEKQRINSSGENNPMYGKPSPQGSGNGWSGWYKDWYFRSLKELSYVVNVLEINKDDWKSAETLGIKIKYTNWDGKVRNYIPDFLVNSKILVEVKPKRLNSSIIVRTKKQAAEEFVKGIGWEYIMVDPPSISKDQIKQLHESGELKFIKRYEKLYFERYIL